MIVDDEINVPVSAMIPVSRSRAVTRGMLCLVPAALCGAAASVIYGALHWSDSALSGRIVDLGVAVAALPLPIAAIILGLRGLRWLLLAAWPGEIAVLADESTLTLRLGPFGTRTFDAANLTATYPFEMSGDFDDGGFEAFIPEDEQLARHLPRIAHPRATEPLNRTILRFVALPEPDAAAALRPVVERWRSRRATGDEPPPPL